MDKTRFRISIAVVGASLIFMALWVPLPYQVFCTLEVEARDAEERFRRIPRPIGRYLRQTGRARHEGETAGPAGERRSATDIADLKGKRDQLESQLESLMRERYHDPQAALDVPTSPNRSTRSKTVEQAAGRSGSSDAGRPLRRLSSFRRPAPCAAGRRGQPAIADLFGHAAGASRISGRRSRRARSSARSAIPKRMQAALVIDQADIDLVAEKRPVVVKVDELAGRRFYSKIGEISKRDLK